MLESLYNLDLCELMKKVENVNAPLRKDVFEIVPSTPQRSIQVQQCQEKTLTWLNEKEMLSPIFPQDYFSLLPYNVCVSENKIKCKDFLLYLQT